MRVLFLTNFYPPYELGGQEQSCRDVVEGLKQRGHDVAVLTSMHGTYNVPQQTEYIHRWLYLEMDLVPFRYVIDSFIKRKAREKHNHQCFLYIAERFKPQVVFVWGMWNLPKSLAVLAETRSPRKVVYRFADYWPTLPSQHEIYWHTQGRRWFTKLPKKLLGYAALMMVNRTNSQPSLKFEHAFCVSEACKRELVKAGLPVSNAKIIRNGIDVTRFMDRARPCSKRSDNDNLRLICAGRLSQEKGVDTAIRAMANLVNRKGIGRITLSLVGSGSSEYIKYLYQLVNQEGLTDYVDFKERVSSSEMPSLLQEFDVLVFPSIWSEPFGRIVLEAMLSGLAVVASSRGGPSEVVEDDVNGLLFSPGNSQELAQKISRIAQDSELRQRLSMAGRRTVLQKFTFSVMIDEIESYLQEVDCLI